MRQKIHWFHNDVYYFIFFLEIITVNFVQQLIDRKLVIDGTLRIRFFFFSIFDNKMATLVQMYKSYITRVPIIYDGYKFFTLTKN